MKQMNRLLAASLILLLGGCGKKQESAVPHIPMEENIEVPITIASSDRDMAHNNIVTAINNKSYHEAEHLLTEFMMNYPDDDRVPSYKLMLADVKYELQQYGAAYEHYRHFSQLYPADKRAEYALFKSAHAMFAQSNGVSRDTTETEETIQLCKAYQSHPEYIQYIAQIEDLASTCKQRLLEKEFYIANAYLNQNKLGSAQQRIEYIAQNFDLDDLGARDKHLFYRAKLAKKQGDQEGLKQYVENLHADFPQSQFTAMGSRLGKFNLLIA